ncbi:MAG: hypothetical protein KC656_17305 [Myxococcales bacterium]|nr:hypothetical protein [Myxococcales bacterium]
MRRELVVAVVAVGLLVVAGGAWLLMPGEARVQEVEAPIHAEARPSSGRTVTHHAEVPAQPEPPTVAETPPAEEPTGPEATLRSLQALSMDREVAAQDEQRAFQKLMIEGTGLLKQLTTELSDPAGAGDPDALWTLARAEVAFGDLLAQSEMPEGLNEEQTSSYTAQIEKMVHKRYEAAEALLDKMEAVAPDRSADAERLRGEIQAR